jgi:hypothetical protein
LAQTRRGLLLEAGAIRIRHIRVASKQELKERIMAAVSDINRDPVVHTSTYMRRNMSRFSEALY